MKMLFITANPLDVAGGREKIMDIVVDYFSKKDWEIIFLVFIESKAVPNSDKWVLPFKLYPQRVNVYRMPKPKRLSSVYYFVRGLFGVYRYGSYPIAKTIKDNKDFDLIIVDEPILLAGAKDAINRTLSKARLISWDHGNIARMTNYRTIRDKIRFFLLKNVLKKWLKNADAIFAISSGIKEIITSLGLNSNIYVVYNPIAFFNVDYIKDSQKTIFIYVGRIDNKVKGIDFILKCLADFKQQDWGFVLIGDGKDKDVAYLKELSKSLGIADRLIWHGYNENPWDLVKEATCLLFASWFEGFPLVLVESIERGLPVIASDCPTGPRDIVQHGINGFLFEPGNQNEFKKYVSMAIEGNMKMPDKQVIANTVIKYEKGKILEKIEKAIDAVLELEGRFIAPNS